MQQAKFIIVTIALIYFGFPNVARSEPLGHQWAEQELEAFRILALREGRQEMPYFPPSGEVAKWTNNAITFEALGEVPESSPQEFLSKLRQVSPYTDIQFRQKPSETDYADITIIYASRSQTLKIYEEYLRQASNTVAEHYMFLEEIKDVSCTAKSKFADNKIEKSVIIFFSKLKDIQREMCLNAMVMVSLGAASFTDQNINTVMALQNNAGRLTPLDKKILELLYNPNVLLGMKWKDVSKVLSE